MAVNHKITITIPTTVNVNQVASPEIVRKWSNQAKRVFAELFGGFTSHTAVGGWMSRDKGLVEENVIIVSSFTDAKGLNRLSEVKAFASRIAVAMTQEAVAVEVDQKMVFVPPLSLAA